MLDIDPLREGPPPLPAATVVLLRDAEHGLEVFLVRRARAASFMGGAYVFPGGKLEAADTDPALLARVRGLDAPSACTALGEDVDGALALGLHVAALRETFEEAGVLFADAPRPFDREAARARLAANVPFATLAHELDWTLACDALVPFARWITPAVEARRFDARFFVAIVRDGGSDARHDDAETITSAWKTPREAVEQHLAGRIHLPPPTLRTLEEIAEHDRARDVLEAARSRKPPLVRPVFRDLGGTWILALPGDPEHPERTPVVPGPTRFTLRDGRFVSG